mmetsp:Transcript_38754/g.51061  ORF Transcript_38754/g.51061 Transcript_38754/m.51061 type:complete len:112 (-) Transcript_38754:661-996(-)
MDRNDDGEISKAALLWGKLRKHHNKVAIQMLKTEREELMTELKKVRAAREELEQSKMENDLCKICFDRQINTTTLNCGHSCMCDSCGRQMTCCPLCMQDIQQLVWEPPNRT